VKALGHHMEKDLIQMIDSGNIKDAIKFLGGDDSNSNISDLLRTRAIKRVKHSESKLHEHADNPKKLDEWKKENSIAIARLNNIEEQISSIEMATCCLCLTDMKSPTLLNCCQNITCASCTVSWVKSRNICPFCRYNNPKITHLSKYVHEDHVCKEIKEIHPQNDKFGKMIEIAKKSKKMIIFAMHDDQFDDITKCLDMNKISSTFIKGHVSTRQKALDSYIHGDTKVLVLNSRVNGAGLNLQITTDIILWHAMPVALTKQMIGRALRYGIDHPLNVHKFFNKDEEC
jgi:hypothetical protein